MPSDDVARQSFFVKPTCVRLLHLASTPATTSSSSLSAATAKECADQLRTLQQLLHGRDQTITLSASLLGYLFFPLVRLLSLPGDDLKANETVLEYLLLVLQEWTVAWQQTESGAQATLDRDLLRQLWTFCILTLGGPLDNSLGAKGRQKVVLPVWSEESILAALGLLKLLASFGPGKSRQTAADPPVGPFDAMELNDGATNGCAPIIALPVLAHSVSTMLQLALHPEAPVQRAALSALEEILSCQLSAAGQEHIVARFLPGITSSILKLLPGHSPNQQNGGNTRSEVLVAGLSVLEIAIPLAFRGIDNASDATVKLQDLTLPSPAEQLDHSSMDNAIRSANWVRATQAQLRLSLLALRRAGLAQHRSSSVQEAYASCLLHIASPLQYHEAAARLILEELLILSRDDSSISDRLQRWTNSSTPLRLTVDHLLRQSLLELPQAILSRGDDEARLGRLLQLIEASARLLQGSAHASKTQALQDAHTWLRNLLFALAPAKLPNVASQRADIGLITPAAIAQTTSVTEDENFPMAPLANIQSQAVVTQLAAAFESLGSLLAVSDGLETCFAIFTFAKSNDLRIAFGALWLLNALLLGAAHARNTASVTHLAEQLSRAVTDHQEANSEPQTENENSLVPVERSRGDAALIDRLNIQAGSTSRASAAQKTFPSDLVQLRCIQLRSMATCAAILQDAFHQHLMDGLYFVLAHLGPLQHPQIRLYANVALYKLAYQLGYASSSNLILAQVDYIINAVSQRLTLFRLDLEAPIVLVAAIQLVGAAILPMVQDLVDEIFDALDTHQEREDLCARLFSVLTALTDAMKPEELPPKAMTEDPTRRFRGDTHIDGLNAPAAPPVDAVEQDDDMPPANLSYEDFKRLSDESNERRKQAHQSVANAEAEVTPDRSQVVCSMMLGKAVPFVQHESSFIRSRVLSLLASGIPILASSSRQSDVMMIVHSVWPYLIRRLDPQTEPESWVRLEAINVIRALGRYVGDIVSRRIVEDVWPKFRVALALSSDKSTSSALVLRMATHSSVYQLYVSIISTMSGIVTSCHLPSTVLWEICMTFRDFFDERAPKALQMACNELYAALAHCEGDSVWLCLQGAVDDTMPEVLRLHNKGAYRAINTFLNAML
ncbi:uncharacterized protein L969DRAFT_49956 [Mixia osmundae IAM 14324]|uniref:uncharacterized protein n=1 Tax=Mixia osmundae (strain CBS 9802 / IAM 14324 / JCM 22182 / KY 12970) TaxID=764103 RepID=UPI0004A54BFC|nr:uncharacterized protein L969DRAFT_49956 [Mixia osmundae IAM 14324]KEI38670.1 hypothetical protein L969DRAFT_49956 [Mixia osmundae IAM 14324]